MAYTSGFFDAVDQGGGNYDRIYSASTFAHYFSLLVKNGVFPDPSTGMQVKASSNPDMHVSVQPGSGWVNGYYITVESNAPEQLTISTANPSLSRIDSVVMGLNYVDREIQLYIKSGAVSASPSAVSLQRDNDLYELELAQITVGAGVASISQANITDMRQNTSRCGIVAGTIDQIDTTDLFAQYNAAFQTWFDGLKAQLEGNVAANLQSQINTLKEDKVSTTYLDEMGFLQKSGGTMTGTLVLKGDPTANLQAATKQYVDNSITPAVLKVLVGSGETVTATKGSKSYSATANSAGWATLYPTEFGTYTVAGNNKSTSVYINAISEFKIALLPPLSNCSWYIINEAANGGVADTCFNIGDAKTISVNGVGYAVVIIGFNHDELTAGGTAGITFQLQNCLDTNYTMNSNNTNTGGWKSCAMRTSTMPALLEQLGGISPSYIKAVNKKSSAGNQSNTINITSDKLFLLSEVEIFGSTTHSKVSEGTQYDYYRAGNSRVKTTDGSSNFWWERSPDGNNSNNFCIVGATGDANSSNTNSNLGVSFGFCI